MTEGSSGVWERLHYDWSNPAHVVLTTTDSNAWGRNSEHTYNLSVNQDGTTTVNCAAVREVKNLRGRLLEVVVASIGKSVLVKAFHNTVKAIEVRAKSHNAAG